MSDRTLEERAEAWARLWHAEQVRKYTGEPYAVHLQAVADMVRPVAESPMVAAAWLHDLVEDTGASHEFVRRKFGAEVAEMVLALTDCGHECGNRAARKKIDRERLAVADWRVQTIKLADLIDNAQSIVANDTKFAGVFLPEKRLLLEVLTEGLPPFRTRAMEVLVAGERRLEQARLDAALQPA